LGSRFKVINLAQRAGRPNDFGNIGAELLLKEGKPIIYVADGMVSQFASPLESSFFKHLIFDAWRRGYLLPWPPRDKILSEAIWRGPDALRGPALGSLLNKYLNFNELWNFISYRFVNTSWNQLLATRSFEARRNFSDPELTPEQYEKVKYSRDKEDFEITKQQIFAPNDARWALLMTQTETWTPVDLRSVTIAIINLASPRYLNRLTTSERQTFVNQASELANRLRLAGFHHPLVAATDFTEDDYVDRVHMSVNGGRKLATILAPVVTQVATELGYLK
jgi:hypothetical protein